MLQRFLTLTADQPAAPALIDGGDGSVTTRAELLAKARELADRLTLAGLTEGELVAVQLPNSVEFVAAFVAALMLRLVFVPIDRDAPETEVAAILSHFSIKGLIYRCSLSVDRCSPEDAAPRTTTNEHRTTTVSIRAVDRPAALPSDARLIKLTSGSTGMPKGIVTSEANLLADCESICATMGIAPNDLNLGAIPFSHSYGFSNLVTPLLVQGTPVVVTNVYLPLSLVELANHYRCTVAPLIPMVFEHLTALSSGRFETVRTFLSAGAPLPASTSRKFRERFGVPIHSFYGCSECGGITYDRPGAAAERGTVGAAMSGVTLSLVGQRLTVKSGSVALGYFTDGFHPFESGTFVTDDLIELDAANEVVLTGRASDLINTAGKKVNPREVEQVILQIDGVREAKVYGEPAGARGEVVAAAVVASPDVTREQVREFCRVRLSLHKVPRIVKLIDAIPVDERGKVKRAALPLL